MRYACGARTTHDNRQPKGDTVTSLTRDLLEELLSVHQGPYLSLYQRTHRHHPDNQQDPIRFRNLVKELEASLGQRVPEAEARALLEPFEALARDGAFWNHTLDGLAVLRAPGIFHALRLPRPVSELVVVGDTFHTKPLRRLLQSADRYHILGLSLDRIRLFEGNRDALDELSLVPGVPPTIADALGAELTEPHQTVASYGGAANTPMRHSHGSKKDEIDIDAERFFRAVDRAVLEHYSRPSGLPLVLAALPEHHPVFHEVSRNPHLIEEGIRANPDALSPEELRERGWQALEPRYRARLAALSEEFSQARAKEMGSGDLAEVVRAATSGRVATLLVEAERQIPGRFDDHGRIEHADLSDPQIDDMLDDLGELVERKGGQVLVIPAERMPTRTGLAATYRY
jgi:hypothetical protein